MDSETLNVYTSTYCACTFILRLIQDCYWWKMAGNQEKACVLSELVKTNSISMVQWHFSKRFGKVSPTSTDSTISSKRLILWLKTLNGYVYQIRMLIESEKPSQKTLHQANRELQCPRQQYGKFLKNNEIIQTAVDTSTETKWQNQILSALCANASRHEEWRFCRPISFLIFKNLMRWSLEISFLLRQQLIS